MSRKTGITLTYRELRMSKLSRNTRPAPCGKELNAYMEAMEYFGQKNLPTSFQKALSLCMENLGENTDKQRSSDMYHLQKFMIRK
eukprot:gene30667-39942_t